MKRHTFLQFIFALLSGVLVSQTVTTTLTYSVNLPAVKNAKTPVLILLHGYGSNKNDLFDLSKAFARRFSTFSLRAPLPVEEGFCWYKLDFLPNGEFKYNYQEAKASRQ